MIASPWHEYWASGGDGERALGNPAQRSFLARHWCDLFARSASPGPIIVDIACGDGAIFGFAREQLQQTAPGLLIALDASDAAVRSAMRATEGVYGAASDACSIPLAAAAADLVVSQFGLEYAGAPAFAEAARILKPGGILSAICHFAQGGIYAECAKNLRLLDVFFQEGLAEHARESLASSYARRDAPALQNDAENKFQHAARRVASALEAAPASVAKTTLASALRDITTLGARRMAYDPTEALAYVDQLKASLSSYRERMRSMVNAALDQPAIDRIVETLASAGMINVAAEPIAFAADGPISAWRIQALRA
jgi:SAM-dependent methyltransferase